MPTPNIATLQVVRNGGAPQTGVVAAAFSDSVVLKLADNSGVKKAKYRIYEYPEGFACPAGWTAGTLAYELVVANGGPTPAFTLPASNPDLRGQYLFDVEVNDRTRDGVLTNDLYDNATLIEIPFTAIQLKDVAYLIDKQADSKRGWVGSLKRLVRYIDQVIISPGGTGDVVGAASSTDDRLVLMSGATGKVIKQSPLSVSDIVITPMLFGAAGNGVTSDNAAILNAITAAIAANKPVNGLGKTYAITGNLTLVSNAWLQDIKCKQLTPGAGTVRTLTSAGGNNIKLVRVTVDRNGDGTNGAHQVDAGIYIDGGSGHYFEDVEVYGDDIGSGFALHDATDCELVGVYTHDIKYLLGADPGNDRVQGIHISGCTRVRLRNCRSNDIGGNFGGGYTLRYSRGYCYSGNTDVQVLGCRTNNVDQGNDTTGGVGNQRFLFSDCYAGDCLTYGFKFANTARDGQVNNCLAERCALSGFIVSGPTGAGMTSVATSDIQFTGCVAYDTGYVGLPGTPVAGGKVGFRVSNGTFDLDTTRGIRFVGCKAHDRQATRTMANGYSNDVTAGLDGSGYANYNEAVGCVSIGNLGAAFQDMHQPRCEVSRVAVQSIPNNAWTAVDWTADVDLGAMHDNVTANSNVYVRRDGNYRSTWGVVFAANATGQRGVRILKDGSVIPGTTVLVNAASAGETALSTSWPLEMSTGANLRIEVFQNSGGALNLQTTSGGVVEQVA